MGRLNVRAAISTTVAVELNGPVGLLASVAVGGQRVKLPSQFDGFAGRLAHLSVTIPVRIGDDSQFRHVQIPYKYLFESEPPAASSLGQAAQVLLEPDLEVAALDNKLVLGFDRGSGRLRHLDYSLNDWRFSYAGCQHSHQTFADCEQPWQTATQVDRSPFGIALGGWSVDAQAKGLRPFVRWLDLGKEAKQLRQLGLRWRSENLQTGFGWQAEISKISETGSVVGVPVAKELGVTGASSWQAGLSAVGRLSDGWQASAGISIHDSRLQVGEGIIKASSPLRGEALWMSVEKVGVFQANDVIRFGLKRSQAIKKGEAQVHAAELNHSFSEKFHEKYLQEEGLAPQGVEQRVTSDSKTISWSQEASTVLALGYARTIRSKIDTEWSLGYEYKIQRGTNDSALSARFSFRF